jgi:hypothetical protein
MQKLQTVNCCCFLQQNKATLNPAGYRRPAFGMIAWFQQEKVMKIELFMENPTDSFYMAPRDINDFSTSRLGAKTAYKPTRNHCFMHNGSDGQMTLPEGDCEVKLSIRREEDGALLLNRSTGRVYRLDNQALNVVECLVNGETPQGVSGQLGIDENRVQEAVDILRAC